MRRTLTAIALVVPATCFACSPSPNADRTGSQASALTSQPEVFYVVLAGLPPVDVLEAGPDATRARAIEIEAEQAALVPMLEARGARVIGRLSRLANAIQVLVDPAEVGAIARLPGVVDVEAVPIVEPFLASAVPVVGAPEVWASASLLQGDGITIGIIDSGIDYTHADFAGIGTADAYLANDPTVIEPGSFPTAKVVGGYDFAGDAYNPSANNSVPKPDQDPLDCTKPESQVISGGHGTHVSGIAAGTGVMADGTSFDGPYEQSFDAASFRVAPGVAPRAKLYALKVFGCDGSTQLLGSALDWAADPNNDGMFDDHLDVVNASLGTPYGLSTKLNGVLVANLTKAGTLLVAAAGNEGQTFFTTGSPAAYPEALSVAASADNEFLSLSVTSPASAVAKYAAAEGGFTTRLVDTGPISGELVASTPALGCTAFTNAAAIAGKLALIDRGSCSFIQKFNNAVAAGAIAAVIVDDEDDPLPFAMGGGDPGTVSIPGVMVTQDDGAKIKAALPQGPVTVGLDAADKYIGAGAELLAGFSSRGPSPIDARVKPEIAAPGFSIDSARVGSGTEPRRTQGTSMSSPVVAGAAALVRQAHPTLSPLAVKAALVNTTEPLYSLSNLQYGVSVVGSGRLAVERAVKQLVTAAADPATGAIGVSFGAVITDVPTTRKRSFVITNHAATDATLDGAVHPTFALPGVDVTIDPPQVFVPAGETATIEVTLTLDPVLLGAPGPDPGTPPTQGFQTQVPRHFLNEANGNIRLAHQGGGAEDVLVPYHGSVRGAVRRKAKAPSACAPSSTGTVEVELVGGGAHPEPVVTAFQLGTLDEEDPDSQTSPSAALVDVRAVGVATDLATATDFDEAQVFFGLAITGTWTTPARGPISVVSIKIDSNSSGGPEFEIRAEPRNPQFGFRDALTANTYEISSGDRISRRPINIVGPDVAKTHPFHSSVLVLSGRLSELEIDPENPTFEYAVVTESPDTLTAGEQVWTAFDAKKPGIDTARHGREGAPLFMGAGPILVEVAPEARTTGEPLDLLVLHHTNVPGEQWEVISLAAKTPGNLGLVVDAPAEMAASATDTVTLVVTNGGEAAANVRASGSVIGGAVTGAEPSQGSCADGPTLDCEIGDLAPAASATVQVSVRAGSTSQSITLSADVESDLECETATDDNAATATTAVIPGPAPKAADELRLGGGCGCRASDAGSPARALWVTAALALVLAARRRRLVEA